MTLRDRAATALDLTLDKAARRVGIHTDAARHYVAWWLDEPKKRQTATARRWVEYLEMIARAA